MSWHASETRTSTRPRRCSRCCGRINIGQRYERYSIPPGGELGFLGWAHVAEHVAADCPMKGASDGDA